MCLWCLRRTYKANPVHNIIANPFQCTRPLEHGRLGDLGRVFSSQEQYAAAEITEDRQRLQLLRVVWTSGDRQGCTPIPTYPYGKSLYSPYIIVGIYGLYNPQESLENKIYKYHGYTVRGTPQLSLDFAWWFPCREYAEWLRAASVDRSAKSGYMYPSLPNTLSTDKVFERLGVWHWGYSVTFRWGTVSWFYP